MTTLLVRMRASVLMLVLLFSGAALPGPVFAENNPVKVARVDSGEGNTPKSAGLDQAAAAEIPDLAPIKRDAHLRGWDYVAQKLRADGVSAKEIRSIYGSAHMPEMGTISYAVIPKETREMYAQFFSEQRLGMAREFMKKNAKYLAGAEKHFGVDRYIVSALLLIETQYGRFTGTSLVIHRLSRAVSAMDPDNLRYTFEEQRKIDPATTFEQVQNRARYLEKTFYPEIPALLEIVHKNKINVFNVKGSVAGAFGIPQFLPTSYLHYAVDGNHDGIVSLYNDADAIWSAANYLKSFGWPKAETDDQKRKVLYYYNHSEAYGNAALELAAKLRS
jgi:membrane-bound lytic murein transglycosylase B